MKTKLLFPLSILAIVSLVGCATSTLKGEKSIDSSSSISSSDISGSTTNIEIADDSVSKDFSLKNSSGASIEGTNGVYTITAAGEYTAAGKLAGQIYVNASDKNVVLSLSGVSISNSSVSPIYVKDCNNFELKVSNGTLNYLYDNRTTDYSTSDTTDGKGAIHVENGDLKVKGKGTLSIISYANSGIHGKDNVSVKNVTMLIKAVNNGIRGNDKITIEENPTLGIVAGNNGLVTHNSDKGSSAQHGYIYITGGTTTINSYGDAIDAAYAVEISNGTDSDGNTYSPILDLYTNIYSSYELTNTSKGMRTGRPGPGGQGGPGGGFEGGGMSGGKSAEKADDSAKGIYIKGGVECKTMEFFLNQWHVS